MRHGQKMEGPHEDFSGDWPDEVKAMQLCQQGRLSMICAGLQVVLCGRDDGGEQQVWSRWRVIDACADPL